MLINPFQNTKASYFDDAEIIDLWVPMMSNDYIRENIMIPDSSIPIRILGGKGSGKTHILRYFSFKSQLIRAERDTKTNILDAILREKYIGVYIVSSSLHVDRFHGKGIDESYWKNIFYYYINLEFLERITSKFIILFERSKYMYVDQIITLDSLYNDNKNLNLEELYQLVKSKREEIDKKISRLSFPGSSTEELYGIDPIFLPTNGCFEIIKTILDNFEVLRDIKVLYILDEFENLSEYQQIYFNTLLRHPQYVKNISIRIAGRLYAIKTNQTLDDKEKLLENSEVKTIQLEDLIEKDFRSFFKSLYQIRIKQMSEIDASNIDFMKSFDKAKDCNKHIIQELTDSYNDKIFNEKKYFKKFKKNLEDFYHESLSETEIDEIIHNLSFSEDVLIEKINTFLCYQQWKYDLKKFSKKLSQNMALNNFGLQKQAYGRFGIDLIYQLLREHKKHYSYSGYNNILTMTNYNPRILLSILDNIFQETQAYKNLNMFKDQISCEIQNNALLEASMWFWNNFTEDVKDHRVVWAVKELCDFFRNVRQASKPSEKTLISFAYNPNEVPDEVNKLIDMAVNHSLLIETNQQRIDKNNSILKRQLRVHPMLAPKWELPLPIGGTITFSKKEIESLFLKHQDEWQSNYEKRLKTLNPPFTNKKTPKVKQEIKKTNTDNSSSIQLSFKLEE